MNAAIESVKHRPELQSVSVVLIGPDDDRRSQLIQTLKTLGVKIKSTLEEYPSTTKLAEVADSKCHAMIIDLDGNQQRALTLVEHLCRHTQSITPMLYSSDSDPALLLRCMRVGARELLTLPVATDVMSEALMQAVDRIGQIDGEAPAGKVYVFHSAKGGAGASTIAANFAIALASESKQRVALVDLNDGLGSLALLLSVSPTFTLLDAIRNPERLDWDFLSTILTQHNTGVHLLAAPDQYIKSPLWSSIDAIEQVLQLLQQNFQFVVVDAGNVQMLPLKTLQTAEAVYVVAQVDIPSLRNAQRMATFLSDELDGKDSVRIILNRFDARHSGIGAAEIERALSFPIAWRIPNDHATVKNAANTGVSLALERSSVSMALRRMAQTVAGTQKKQNVSRGWKMFRFAKA